MITILSQIHTAMGSDEDISDQVTIGFCCPVNMLYTIQRNLMF